MAPTSPRRLAPGVERLVGDDELVEVARHEGIAVLRSARGGRDIAVLHQTPPDTSALVAQLDRLIWLDGRGPAPPVLASGRTAEGAESAVVGLGSAAASVASGLVPFGAELVAEQVAAMLRDLHGVGVDGMPFAAPVARFLDHAADAVDRGDVAMADDGPYAGREPADLVGILVRLLGELGDDPDPVMIHGSPTMEHVWLDPEGPGVLTGWAAAGLGDRHHDLSVAAVALGEQFGPAVVAPFLDAYGLDGVDLRRLDAHQLLVHLLR